jgi:hypothetical protein
MFSIDMVQRARDLLLDRPEVMTAEYEAAQRRLGEQAMDWILTVHEERHNRRMRAFYVDAAADNDAWLRPTDLFSESEAAAIVRDARNDYWQQRAAPGLPEWGPWVDGLNAALAAWADKPELPPVEFTW